MISGTLTLSYDCAQLLIRLDAMRLHNSSRRSTRWSPAMLLQVATAVALMEICGKAVLRESLYLECRCLLLPDSQPLECLDPGFQLRLVAGGEAEP